MAVERLNRTSREEFWACYDGEYTLEAMRPALRKWFQEDYSQVRPHQGLGYMTLAEYVEKIKTEKCLA